LILSRLTTAKAFIKDIFFNQERQLWELRGSDTLVVIAINYNKGGLDFIGNNWFRTLLEIILISGGSIGTNRKLKRIDGRTPPGVDCAA